MEENFIQNFTELLKGRSIFLIGMMGSGKSKTGPALAKLLQYKFIDLDALIEKVVKKSIDNIFTDEGEVFFRDLETKCLNEIIKIPSLVISTGGGVVLKKENWGMLHQGIVVWIDLERNIALERLYKDSDRRPLLANKDIEKTYDKLFDARESLYMQADLQIKVNHETPEKVAEMILHLVNKKITS